MRRIRRIHAAGALAVVLAATSLACTSCKSSSSGASSDAAVLVPGVLTPQQAAQVLARVGDRTITLGDFEAALEHLDQFDRMRYQSPERRKELLGEMIEHRRTEDLFLAPTHPRTTEYIEGRYG